MSVGELTANQLVRAIRIYYRLAYEKGPVPEHRRQFLALSEDQPLAELLALKGVEVVPPSTWEPRAGYTLRLGNDWYPHMKLAIRPYNSWPGFVFAVVTHDGFRLPDGSPEADAVGELRDKNERLCRRIERAWEDDGLPTQKGLLRRYLKRRRREKAGGVGDR